MSATLLQRRAISIPLHHGPFTICILHRGRWHETAVSKPYTDVVGMAEDAYRRSGLAVQVRDADETILFEVNETAPPPRQKPVIAACKETCTW